MASQIFPNYVRQSARCTHRRSVTNRSRMVRRGFVADYLMQRARAAHFDAKKATPNICTSQTLLAVGITAYRR